MAILDRYGRPFATPRRNRFAELLARYDAAQTTDENMRHWTMADSLDPDRANSPEVRRVLVKRSRYEAANNSYCRGMVDTLAGDVIGRGPRVQFRTGAGDQADRFVNREFADWMREVKLARKLRVMRKARATDGEGLGVIKTRRKLPTPVKLFVQTLECDHLATPNFLLPTGGEIDGVRLDADGEPAAYSILKHHPGGQAGFAIESTWYPAENVLHLFRADRAGQHRGIPELTPALRLFSQLRRFTLATLAAAETAADFAAVIETNQPAGDGYGPDDSGGLQPEALDVFELAQRMVTVLPENYKLSQLKAEHPSTTFGQFKREILSEAFAAICMPWNVGAHDSSDSSWASGKLDRLTYGRLVGIERIDWEHDALRPLIVGWFDEAILIPGYLPEGLPPLSQWTITVYWDGLGELDEVKAANAHRIQLASGQRSFTSLYAERGEDCETEWAQQARTLGLSLEEYRARVLDTIHPVKSPNAESQMPKEARSPKPEPAGVED